MLPQLPQSLCGQLCWNLHLLSEDDGGSENVPGETAKSWLKKFQKEKEEKTESTLMQQKRVLARHQPDQRARRFGDRSSQVLCMFVMPLSFFGETCSLQSDEIVIRI